MEVNDCKQLVQNAPFTFAQLFANSKTRHALTENTEKQKDSPLPLFSNVQTNRKCALFSGEVPEAILDLLLSQTHAEQISAAIGMSQVFHNRFS